jgi:NitT/TauT family transport system substrate-binding protein
MTKRLFIMGLFIVLLLAGCSPASQTDPVKVAVLPVLDALPLHVALSQGYFQDEGLVVELIPVSSAPERDALMQSGQADAILNEIVSTLFYNQSEIRVVIVRFLRTATPDYPLFRILASSESGISTVEDLKGVQIGISEATVIHYTTDRMLSRAGLAPDEISTITIPKIPDRIALLASGELAAANLPDPAASAALLQGAVLVIDDTTTPEISSSVLTFDADLVQSSPETIRRFLAAVEKAVLDINADKAAYLDMMIELGLLPPPLVGSYAIPDFPLASVPSRSQFEDALDWALELGLITDPVSYSDSVTSEFLP